MYFYDTHFHLKNQEELQAILNDGRHFNLKRFFLIAADYKDSLIASKVAQQEEDVYAVVGIHPHSCKEFDGNLKAFEELLSSPKVVAVGEIGLDYFYDFSTPQEQIPVFAQFLDLAQKINKPAVIHCREAFKDCIPILKEQWQGKTFFEVHSFTGTLVELREILDLGAFISFNGMITFNNAEHIRDLLHYVPEDRLLIETDSPFLTPQPYRKYQNSPKYIPVIAQKIADLKNKSLEEIANMTCHNANTFFGLEDLIIN